MKLEIIRALRHRQFLFFWSASWFSYSGEWLYLMALSWLVLDMTDSPFYLGLLGLVRGVPAFFSSLLGGVLADRINRKWLFFITLSWVVVMSVIIGLIATLRVGNVWLVLGLTFIWSIAYAANNTTRQALVPQLVEPSSWLNAIALNSAVVSGGRIIGPLFAGLIIVKWGIGNCFYTNALMIMPLLLVILTIKVPNPSAAASPGNIFRRFTEGLSYAAGHPRVAWLLLFNALATFFGMAYTVMLPVFARDILNIGAGGFGLLMSVSAGGGLMMSLVAANLGKFPRKGLLVLGIGLAFGLVLVAFARSTWLPLSLILIFIAGAANRGYLTLVNSSLVSLVPEELRGRVMSLYMISPTTLHHLGSLFLGALASAIGSVMALSLSGLTLALSTVVITLKARRIRHL